MSSTIRRHLGRVKRWLLAPPPPATAAAGTEAEPPAQIEVFEATHMLGRTSTVDRPRFNLLLPTLKPEHVFGGISTALQFFDALVGDEADARIILSDQGYPPESLPPLLQGWRCVDADGDDVEGRIILPFADRGIRTLPVRRGDVFVATAWWTAYAAQRLLPWQAQAYGTSRTPLVYLVQDHEPGFYPLSTRYLMARSTYEYDGPMVGVFNTGLLHDYFQRLGYAFTHGFAFEPQLNPALAAVRARANSFLKERHIILYGRPGVPRNAFEMVCQGVRHWSALEPQAAQWRIESLGEPHGEVGLHHGARIVSRGKLSLDEYAHTLSSAAIGVSLMLSPHPSYPPLEMAEFGVQTITNHYENKDLSLRSPLIHSLRTVTPEAIGAQIRRATLAFAQQPQVQVDVPAGSLFAPTGQAFPFAGELREGLRTGRWQ